MERPICSGGGGGAYRQRNTVYHKILIISVFDCALPVRKCTVKVSSKHLFSKSPGWYSVRDSLLEKGVKISMKCIL